LSRRRENSGFFGKASVIQLTVAALLRLGVGKMQEARLSKVGEKNQDVLYALLGSAIFFCMAPGLVAGVGPGAIAGWQIGPPFLGFGFLPVIGVILIVVGAAGLLDSTARFALKGRGTPAPFAPTETLVVTGLYRYMRNPMYVAIVTAILGQALLFGNIQVLGYAAVVWCLFHLFVIKVEEPTLRSKFGESYIAYQSSVRRWCPRIKPWSREEGADKRRTPKS
jgi:protein-S-isoprenylcysteine O-methyltransferase Ste14